MGASRDTACANPQAPNLPDIPSPRSHSKNLLSPRVSQAILMTRSDRPSRCRWPAIRCVALQPDTSHRDTTNDVSFFKHHREVEHRQGPPTRERAPVKKSIYSLIDLREILFSCNRRYLAHLSALDDFSVGVRALDRLTKPRWVKDKTVKGINFFDPVDNALLHALQDPRVNIAGIRRADLMPLLDHISPPRSLTPASKDARHRRDQAGGRNLRVLSHPTWTKCHSSALPPDPERSHSGSDLIGIFGAESVTSWLIRD